MTKGSVDDTIARIFQGRKKRDENAQEQDKKLQRIRENIRAGKESTGDVIKDFLIAWAWDYQGNKRGEIESLQAKVNSAVGNPLLVVSVLDMQEPDYHVDGVGQDRPVPHHLERHYNLKMGVVTNNLGLDVKKGQAVIPAERYAERQIRDAYVSEHGKDVDKPSLCHDKRDSMWKHTTGNIVLSSTEIVSEAVPSDFSAQILLSLGTSETGIPRHRTHLYTGNEISNFFVYGGFRGEEQLDLSYVDALELLGLKVPDKFREGHGKFLDTRRIEIYAHLDSLVAREMAASRDVRETEKRAKEIQKYRDDDWSREDSETWSKWNSGAECVKSSRAKIAEHLREVIELGLHKSPRVIELVPGKSVDFQKYFSGVLGNYLNKNS